MRCINVGSSIVGQHHRNYNKKTWKHVGLLTDSDDNPEINDNPNLHDIMDSSTGDEMMDTLHNESSVTELDTSDDDELIDEPAINIKSKKCLLIKKI
jgi:hypothetical protein